jgi:hypothetical protein
LVEPLRLRFAKEERLTFFRGRVSGADEHDSFKGSLYATSNFLSKIGFRLPVVVVVAYILPNALLLVLDPIFFSQTDVSHFAVLRDQYYFLLSKHSVAPFNKGYFHIFEMFIWISSIVAALRVLTGVCSRTVLLSSRTKLDNMKARGVSTSTALIFLLAGAPFAMLCSVSPEVGSSPDFLLRLSPQLFVAFMAFVFCGAVILFAEGILSLMSVIFIRKKAQDGLGRGAP